MRLGQQHPRTSTSGRRWATLVVILVATGLSVPNLPATAAAPETSYDHGRVDAPNPQVKGRWAERTATAGDLDGDGVNDLIVGDTKEDVADITDAGRVYTLSGRTLSTLLVIDSPEPQAQANFGFFISNVGDVSGDGRPDIAVGTDAQDVGGRVDEGKAWVFNGVTGIVLYALNNPAPQPRARFGSRIGRAGDLNGDGKAEVIVGASGNDVPAGCAPATGPVPAGCRRDQGQAFIFDGATGALFRALNLPVADQVPAPCSSSCGGFGVAVQGPGDTDGDRIVDQMVDASNIFGRGAMYVFSGATGALLLRVDDPVPQPGATFGFQDVAPLAPGDVNGDGFADLYGNGFAQNGPTGSPSAGRAWVFNGRTGAVLYELIDPTPGPGGQFGWSMDATDYDKDGKPDLYVGSSPHHVSGIGISQRGGTYIFRGSDGALLKTLELGPRDAQDGTAEQANLGSNLGWALAAPGDLDGDGEPDYVAGAPFQDVGQNQDQGQLFVFRQQGYTLVAADGGIFNFGTRFAGSTGSIRLNKPVVAMAHTANLQGYWLVASDGGVFAFGDAGFFGSTGDIVLNQPVVGMAATPTNNGYWFVAADGGIFAFGDAGFFGSTGSLRLNSPVVALASTPTGNGYWLMAADGGVFAFGDAGFFGSTGDIKLNQPMVGATSTPSGNGYWMVASDGGVFAFGDATFLGSTGAVRLKSPMVHMVATPSGEGYLLAAADGGVFSFGNAPFRGSTGDLRLNSPVVGLAAAPTHHKPASAGGLS